MGIHRHTDTRRKAKSNTEKETKRETWRETETVTDGQPIGAKGLVEGAVKEKARKSQNVVLQQNVQVIVEGGGGGEREK
jgi:hypothetical protein